MIWNLKCRRLRSLLALWAGNDIEVHERIEAERHLAVCPGCRSHWAGLQAGQQALEQVRTGSVPLVRHEQSVWPAVYRQVRSLAAAPAAPRWHGWLPAGALAAACIAVAVTLSPGFAPDSANTAGRAPVVIDAQRVDSPGAGAIDRKDDETPALRRRQREWNWPPHETPGGTRVRTLLDGSDVRDL